MVRGQCHASGCLCCEYQRSSDLEIQNCSKCDHPPGQHAFVTKLPFDDDFTGLDEVQRQGRAHTRSRPPKYGGNTTEG